MKNLTCSYCNGEINPDNQDYVYTDYLIYFHWDKEVVHVDSGFYCVECLHKLLAGLRDLNSIKNV